jgi:hypothetical protein
MESGKEKEADSGDESDVEKSVGRFETGNDGVAGRHLKNAGGTDPSTSSG